MSAEMEYGGGPVHVFSVGIFSVCGYFHLWMLYADQRTRDCCDHTDLGVVDRRLVWMAK